MNVDISKIIQQAQKIQEQMKQVQKERENIEVIGTSGAGLISVTMTGKYDIKNINIDDSLMSEDKYILEDLIAAAVNSAVKQVEKKISTTSTDIYKMAKDAGIDIPGDINFPFK